MTDAQWKRTWDLYEVASRLTSEETARFVAGLSDEAEIVEELRTLLSNLPETERDEAGSFHGQTLGAYEVLRRVGRGASADVYAARDTRLGRTVALKFLKGRESSLNRRFLLEAQSISALNHPNIVTVHEVIEGPEGPVLVMEMVEGEPLRKRLLQPVGERAALRIGLQIAQALTAAHAGGFVHRDLKPENVILRPDGYVKVLDFGLVRRWSVEQSEANLTSTAGLPVGTLRYMSPEQCRGETATPKSDIFALGLVLYELLAGRHPFAESAGLEVAHALATAEAPRLKGVHSALGGIVMRMLAKSPAERPTAREAVAALEAMSGAGPVMVEEPPLPAGRRVSRRSLIGTAAGLAAAATAAGVWWRRREPAGGVLVRGGAVLDPSFSPDGEEIAFSWRKPGAESSRIYVVSVAGGEPRPLTAGEANDWDPLWSPDGASIYFCRVGKGENAVYEISREGTAERRVVSLHSTPGWTSRLGRLEPGKLSAVDMLPGRGFRIFEVDLATGGKRLLLPEQSGTGEGVARISPDGKTLLYSRSFGTNTRDLFVRPVAGGPERRITFDEQPKPHIRWAPDGRSIVYRAPKPVWRIWETGLGNNRDRQATTPQLAFGNFDIGPRPDGRRHLVIAQMVDQAAIWRMERKPDGNFTPPVRLITTRPGVRDVNPSISPDGGRIAFMSTRTGRLELWIADADGTHPRQITALSSRALGIPGWSADGRTLISSVQMGGAGEIFLVEAEPGAAPKRLLSRGQLDSDPQFSPDHRVVSFISGLESRTELFRMPASGGRPEPLTRNGCVVHRYSPDGRWIYFVRRNDVSGLYRIPSAGGSEELVLPELRTVFNRSWAVARNGIYYAAQALAGEKPGSPEAWEIRRFDPRLGTKTAVARLPLPPVQWSGALSVAPDESWMLLPLLDPVVGELVYYPNWQ